MKLTHLSKLIQELKRLPGVGEKTAARYAQFLLRQPVSTAHALAASIVEAKERTLTCSVCCNFSETEVCGICADTNRSEEIICVVEEPTDIAALEKAQSYRGKYHVLHGSLSPLEGIDEQKLRIAGLEARVKQGGVKEVILATNPTVEGDTTALYIARLIQYNGVKISRIAHGIPVGGEIEYLDGATLGRAIQNRIELN